MRPNHRNRGAAALLFAALCLGAPAAARAEGEPSARKQAIATRVASPPVLDGRLDEAVWREAAVLDGFVQRIPDEGQPASERTEVRLLYDASAFYVGVWCYDSRARELIPVIGRRDHIPPSDKFGLSIDTAGAGRTAYFFVVNLGGTQEDGFTVEGQPDNLDWDGLWDAETRIDERGWYAELRIPFATLRLPTTGPQVWGFHVRRWITRLDEQDEWNLIRALDGNFIARHAELSGISGVRRGVALQLSPYASGIYQAARIGPERPGGGLLGQVGLDAKYGLTEGLTLAGTVNPDFAQVEADPAVLNLGAYEVHYPEKRPFFLEGLDIFQSAGPFVYTRRIGAAPPEPGPRDGGEIVSSELVAPIRGAAKLTGDIGRGTSVGLLGAFVGATSAIERVPVAGGFEDRRIETSPNTLFAAARVRQHLGPETALGLTATSVVRGSHRPDASLLAADLDLRGRGDYSLWGYAGWSFTPACGPGGRCDALGAHLEAGKTGGELQAYVHADYVGAEHDLQDMGFAERLVGNGRAGLTSHLVLGRRRLWGPFRTARLEVSHELAWNPAVRTPEAELPLVANRLAANAMVRLRNQWELELGAARSFDRFDDAETRLNPAVRLYRRPVRDELLARVRSDDTLPFLAELSHRSDAEGGGWTHTTRLNLSVIAGSHVQAGLGLSSRLWRGRPLWLDASPAGYPVLGSLSMNQAGIEAYLTAALTRKLTAQVFSQVLYATQTYSRVAELRDPYTALDCDPAVCLGGDPARTNAVALLSAVLRWEFLPLSTAYLVYTHQGRLEEPGARFGLQDGLQRVSRAPSDDVLSVKVSYTWAL